MSHQKITIAELNFIARTNLAAGQWQPIILLGAPGAAKTMWFTHELPKIYAEAMGCSPDDIGIVIERPARRDAAEIAGVALPAKDAEGNFCTQFTKSPLLAQVEAMLASGKKYVILLWDEIAAAKDPEQKVARDSFDPNEHSIGGRKLPLNCIVGGTGNRA